MYFEEYLISIKLHLTFDYLNKNVTIEETSCPNLMSKYLVQLTTPWTIDPYYIYIMLCRLHKPLIKSWSGYIISL